MLTILCLPAFGAVANAAVTVSQDAQCTTKVSFFGLVPWYKYLTLKRTTYDTNPITYGCDITNFDSVKVDSTCVDKPNQPCATTNKVLGAHSPFLLISLAILDDLVRVAALVAVAFVVIGGLQYTTSQGSPDDTKHAQQTIINALIGVVLAVLAASIVSYIGNTLGRF